jgi:hypothetical protein
MNPFFHLYLSPSPSDVHSCHFRHTHLLILLPSCCCPPALCQTHWPLAWGHDTHTFHMHTFLTCLPGRMPSSCFPGFTSSSGESSIMITSCSRCTRRSPRRHVLPEQKMTVLLNVRKFEERGQIEDPHKYNKMS